MRSLLLTAAVLLFPALVHASDLRVSSYEMSESGGVIVIESDAPIGEPWMRTDAHSVRIWFPDVKYVARFEHARDAQEPIRALMLRPGSDDSAVLRIEFGPGVTFTREDVEVTRDGQAARVRVRLPVAQPAGKTAPVAAAAKQPSAAEAKPLYPQQPAVQPTAASPRPAATSGATGTEAIRAAAAASDKQRGLEFSNGSRGGLTGLAIISGLLLAAYAGIRSLGKKRVSREPDIQVLSARRLGHRSELLVVRALGADHLLMSSAGRIERVASVPSPVAPSLSLPPAPLPSMSPYSEPDSQAEGLGIISKLSSRSRLRKLLDAVDQEPAHSEPPPRPSGRPSFGPELLSAIHHHKLNAVASLPPMAAPANIDNNNKQSDAVAGIARLRAGTRGTN
jgi:hypothetical protein